MWNLQTDLLFSKSKCIIQLKVNFTEFLYQFGRAKSMPLNTYQSWSRAKVVFIIISSLNWVLKQLLSTCFQIPLKLRWFILIVLARCFDMINDRIIHGEKIKITCQKDASSFILLWQTFMLRWIVVGVTHYQEKVILSQHINKMKKIFLHFYSNILFLKVSESKEIHSGCHTFPIFFIKGFCFCRGFSVCTRESVIFSPVMVIM